MDPHGGEAYAVASVVLSSIAFGLAVYHLSRTTRAYRTYHDERAALALAKAVGLLVASMGLLLSSTGLVVSVPLLAVGGLSLARGAFLVLLATLVLVDVRPGASEGGKE